MQPFQLSDVLLLKIVRRSNSQQKETGTLRILEMSGLGCQVTTCFEARFGVSLGGSGVSIGGVRILRAEDSRCFLFLFDLSQKSLVCFFVFQEKLSTIWWFQPVWNNVL